MENKPKTIKLDPLLIRDLWSGEEKILFKTLRKLRTSGNIGYIPELLKLLNQVPDEHVRKELIRFIADVKKPAVIPVIIAGLKDEELKAIRASLVSACWQSGLDYSHHLGLFVQLFFEGDYATSLESFTVIEEAAIDLGRDELNKILAMVQKGLKKLSDDKKLLARELVKLLEA